MTLTLEVPTALTEKLARVAAAKGIPVAEYALELLDAVPEPTPPAPQFVSYPATNTDADPNPGDIRTGAELVAYWRGIGAIGSDAGTEDSSAVSRRLRAEIENERRVRHQ